MAETTAAYVPRCVQRSGKECRDCVECLSAIPGGKTCASCVHAYRCNLMFGVESPETQHFCEWIPSRYRAAVSPEGR